MGCEILWGRETRPRKLQIHAVLKAGAAQAPGAWLCGQTCKPTSHAALGDSLRQKLHLSSSTASLVSWNKSFPCLTQQKGFQDCGMLPPQELWACLCAAGLALHPHGEAQLPSAGHSPPPASFCPCLSPAQLLSKLFTGFISRKTCTTASILSSEHLRPCKVEREI